MGLLGKIFFFVFIGCAYCQNFGFPDGSSDGIGRVNLEQYKAVVSQVLMILQVKCQQAGENEAGQEIAVTAQQVQKCVENKVNFEQLIKEFGEAARTNELPSFMKTQCKLWPDIHGCINPLVSLIKKCLTREEKDAVDKNIELLDDSNNFICENNAKRLTNFINAEGFQCYALKQNEVQQCTVDVQKARAQREQKSNSIVPVYDKEACSDFQDVRRCLVNKLSTCPSNVPSQITDEYLGMVHKKVCNSASSLTWFSFVNIILLLGTYMYSKMF